MGKSISRWLRYVWRGQAVHIGRTMLETEMPDNGKKWFIVVEILGMEMELSRE